MRPPVGEAPLSIAIFARKQKSIFCALREINVTMYALI